MSDQVSNNTPQQNQAPVLPEVRTVPTWAPDAKIVISGYEWEALQNGLTAVQEAQQAAQAILSRNIVEGVITMDFEKLDAKTLTYSPMSDEDKKPYRESFALTIAKVKEQQAAQAEAATKLNPVVDNTDEAGTSEEPRQEAKVVSINTKK